MIVIFYLVIISLPTYFILSSYYKKESIKNAMELEFTTWTIVSHCKEYSRKQFYPKNQIHYHQVHFEPMEVVERVPESFKLNVELSSQNVLIRHRHVLVDITEFVLDKNIVDGSQVCVKGKIFVFNNKIVKFELKSINHEIIVPVEYLF